jgi:hypothetical protein
MISLRMTTAAVSGVFLVMFLCWHSVANSPAQPAPDKKDLGKLPLTDEQQVKELQKQLAELKKQVSDLQKTRVVAAGTATWERPRVQANRTSTRVKLAPEITAQLGKDYIVLLTNRYPAGGYPWFECYWKAADNGFDITLVDPTLGGLETASYVNGNTSYLIDWVVVKK